MHKIEIVFRDAKGNEGKTETILSPNEARAEGGSIAVDHINRDNTTRKQIATDTTLYPGDRIHHVQTVAMMPSEGNKFLRAFVNGEGTELVEPVKKERKKKNRGKKKKKTKEE